MKVDEIMESEWWERCLFVSFDWIWLQMLHRIAVTPDPGADNITNDITTVITSDCVHLFWQHGSQATGWHRKSDGRWTCKYKKDLSFSTSFRSMELRLIMMKFHKCYNVTSTRMKNIFISLSSICFSMQFWCKNEIDC